MSSAEKKYLLELLKYRRTSNQSTSFFEDFPHSFEWTRKERQNTNIASQAVASVTVIFACNLCVLFR